VAKGGDRGTYPNSSVAWIIEEDEDKSYPEPGKHGNKAENYSHNHRCWNEISESLHSKETGEGITLHGLEDIIFGCVKDFWVIASAFFDREGNFVGNSVWEDNFALSAR
jgi:hypothetical protein